jgi:hypothetical protein
VLAPYAAWAKFGLITPIGPTIDPHPIAQHRKRDERRFGQSF